MTEQERWEEMKKMMEGLSAQVLGVKEDVSDVKKDLGEQIREGRRETEALKDRMDKNDAEFSDKVAAVVAGLGLEIPGAQSGGMPAPSQSSSQSSMMKSYASCAAAAPSGPDLGMRSRPTKEDRYWLCRRSLRVWPVKGDDIRKAFGEFLRNRLGLGAYFLADMGEMSVKRVTGGPAAKLQHEVIVVFSTVEVRDVVKRAAKELAGAQDAGIRLEVPNYLKPSLQALEAVSYHLKQKHSGIKRSIKYCDDDMDLVLDFNVNPSGNGAWRRVSAAQAKTMKPKLSKGPSGRTSEVTNDELESMLGDP